MGRGTAESARYLGRLILEPLPDGRLMRLVAPFGFLDPKKQRWPVPVGAKIDGASIPRPLWSLIGGPFEGKYRNASVIHDYYCDVRSRPWRDVHRVFYDAMRVSRVTEHFAKLMYAAVYFAGPRWSDTAVDNSNLPRVDDPTILFHTSHSEFSLGVFDAVEVAGESAGIVLRSGEIKWPRGDEIRLDLDQVEVLIDETDPTLDEIDRALDAAASILEPPMSEATRKRVIVSKEEP